MARVSHQGGPADVDEARVCHQGGPAEVNEAALQAAGAGQLQVPPRVCEPVRGVVPLPLLRR
jgi:hypothetical protein